MFAYSVLNAVIENACYFRKCICQYVIFISARSYETHLLLSFAQIASILYSRTYNRMYYLLIHTASREAILQRLLPAAVWAGRFQTRCVTDETTCS